MTVVQVAKRCAAWFAVLLLATSGLLLTALGLGPRTGAYRTLTVLTGSMDPAIPTGSVVLVTQQSTSEIRVGHIITYSIPVEDHRVITHRVVEVVERGPHPVFRTKGDANEAPDPWAARAKDPTVWRVRAVVPVLGNVVRWLRLPVVQRMTVLAIPAILALVWLGDIWRPRKVPEPAGV